MSLQKICKRKPLPFKTEMSESILETVLLYIIHFQICFWLSYVCHTGVMIMTAVKGLGVIKDTLVSDVESVGEGHLMLSASFSSISVSFLFLSSLEQPK